MAKKRAAKKTQRPKPAAPKTLADLKGDPANPPHESPRLQVYSGPLTPARLYHLFLVCLCHNRTVVGYHRLYGDVSLSNL